MFDLRKILFAALASTALLSVVALGAPADDRWDGDGGHSADYSDIPRLQWTGPGMPGTYQDYIERRQEAPFRSQLVFSGGAGRTGGRAPKALVLVESNLYSGIQSNLNVYVADLQAEGYTVDVHTTSGGTGEDLKTFILNHTIDLVGCVLVGEHPAAWFEFDYWGYEEFPCDLYYMDLDGTWIDGDNNDKWDSHAAGAGDVGPEIYIGHIDASMMTGDEVALTNTYLDKLHAFRTGAIFTPNYGLTYTEDDWSIYMDMRTDIKYAYTDFDDIPAPDTNRDDYVNYRVPDQTYEFIQLCCHSSSTGHAFTRGGWASNWDIMGVVPRAMFYNLFCCSSLRYTDQDFLGGAYIYNSSRTSLAVIGSTKTGSMLEFYAFYQPFGLNESFGEAFRQWFNYIAPYNDEEIAWHYGMTVAGDPFLGITKPALFVQFPDGPPNGMIPPGPATPLRIEIKPGDQSYVPGSGLLHYRMDPAGAFSTASLSPLGGDLYQAILPAATPGDTPELYFSALGDGGTTIFSPPDAPTELYSFDVAIVYTTWQDDFETSTGWSVENISLTSGAWERCVPNPTSGQQVAPLDDNPAGTGTYCFVTDNGPPNATYSDHDIDGGPTRLISPTLDLTSGGGIPQVTVYVWHYANEADDPFDIEISNDDGATWVNVYTTSTSLAGWTKLSFNVADYVMPNDRIKVRFSSQDNPNNSITESGVDDFKIERVITAPSLYAHAYTLSSSSGGAVDLVLDAGASHSSREYMVAGTMSGVYPGTMLPGGLVIPLNRDALTNYILSHLTSPMFLDFKGNLDGQGKGLATLDTLGPMSPQYIGETLSFAFTLTQTYDFVSNPVSIVIEP